MHEKVAKKQGIKDILGSLPSHDHLSVPVVLAMLPMGSVMSTFIILDMGTLGESIL